MRESGFQTKCIAHLNQLKIYHVNLHADGWTGKGAPDLLVCMAGRFVAFELKVDDNELEPAQRIHKLRIERNGGLHYAPRTLKEFIQIIESLKLRGAKT